MRLGRGKLASVAALVGVALGLCLWPAGLGRAQGGPEVYTATAIASEGLSGASGRISLRITAYTTAAEKKSLLEAFQRNPEDGLAMLRSMSKGYINIEGRPGRKIEAVFARPGQQGRDLIVIGEHVASGLEQWRGVNAGEHPVAVVHLRFAADGTPLGGEIFPAVKLAVTPDGFLDVETDASNKVMLFNLARQ